MDIKGCAAAQNSYKNLRELPVQENPEKMPSGYSVKPTTSVSSGIIGADIPGQCSW